MKQNEKLLVGFTVFNTLLSVFTYFNIAYNGIGTNLFGGKIGLIVFALYFITVLVCGRSNTFDKQNTKYAVLLAFALFLIWLITLGSADYLENFYILALFYIGVYVSFRDDLKIICFEWFIKAFSIILAISLFEFIIYSVSGVGVVLFTSISRLGDNDVTLTQLLFNLLTDSDSSFIYRFQCLSEEPGVIGTVCGFLIFLTRGNEKYKKEYYVFLIAGLLSFTLAFYALFLLHLFNASTIKFKQVLTYTAIVFLGFVFFRQYIDDFLLYRIAGRELSEIDNRSAGDFAHQFDVALQSGHLWLSNYSKGYNINGAGLKMFIWRYGLVSLFLIFGAYSYVFFKWKRRYRSKTWATILFFLAFWISFYQRHYITNMEYFICFFSAPLLYGTQNRVLNKKGSVSPDDSRNKPASI